MKIMVTGGCGFIGTNLIKQLLQDKENQVLNIDKLTYCSNPEAHFFTEGKNYQFLKTDIIDPSSMREAIFDFMPDAVMHLAAESHVDRSINSSDIFIETNIKGTHNLLKVCLEFQTSLPNHKQDQFRFLHISTDEVFGSLGEFGFFNENSPYKPNSPYSASKASSDHLVRSWHKTYGLNTIVTNCSNNYGPFQFPEKLIPLMILNALQKKPLPVYGNGLQVRDWIHVQDHVNALILVLKKGQVGSTYCIGGDCEKTNLEVIHQICDFLDLKFQTQNESSYKNLITKVEDRPGHDTRYAIDSSKIKNELGFEPKKEFSIGLSETIDWYLQNNK